MITDRLLIAWEASLLARAQIIDIIVKFDITVNDEIFYLIGCESCYRPREALAERRHRNALLWYSGHCPGILRWQIVETALMSSSSSTALIIVDVQRAFDEWEAKGKTAQQSASLGADRRSARRVSRDARADLPYPP